MKHTLSILALCSALHAFHAHAMFKFDDTTTQQITTMLKQMQEVATENNLTANPAAQVYAAMQDVIAKDGLPALVEQQAVNTWMQKMYTTYKEDPEYTTILRRAQSLSKAKSDVAEISWKNVMIATIASLTTTTESNSSFKCPRTQDRDYMKQYFHVLKINENAKIEDGDIWKACTLMTYYQMQERNQLKLEATKTDNAN